MTLTGHTPAESLLPRLMTDCLFPLDIGGPPEAPPSPISGPRPMGPGFPIPNPISIDPELQVRIGMGALGLALFPESPRAPNPPPGKSGVPV